MKQLSLAFIGLLSVFLVQAQTDSAKKDTVKQEYGPDWANVRGYHDRNVKFGTFKTGTKGVVFMGDSITDAWILVDSAFWSANPFVDRGISGQTTTQMLVRFRQDVINLKPSVVVILAGINDIAQNNGFITVEDIFGNIKSMAILAREAGIKVVLCSVLPANHFPWRPQIIPTEKVAQLNAMIQQYATESHTVYCDYFSKMVDDQRGLPASLASDGIHPTLAGYRLMEPLVQNAIAAALKEK